MEKSILITGGARSGKSALAERLALEPTGQAIYIATAEAHDAEMETRIAAHKARRGPEWRDVHAPLDLITALSDTDNDHGHPRLVDCLTLWLSNLMLGGHDWQELARRTSAHFATQRAPVIFVTNEVGAGIVPENALARSFRDAAGWVNQSFAKECEAVWLCVAGYPVRVKPAR